MRRQLSEAEKAETVLQEQLASDLQTVESLETAIGAIELYHKLDRRNAVCALRDYFQWILAGMQDAALAETQARIAELEKKLGKNQ